MPGLSVPLSPTVASEREETKNKTIFYNLFSGIYV